jgi:hypothetical protein
MFTVEVITVTFGELQISLKTIDYCGLFYTDVSSLGYTASNGRTDELKEICKEAVTT